jgi:hypothetical protein
MLLGLVQGSYQFDITPLPGKPGGSFDFVLYFYFTGLSETH